MHLIFSTFLFHEVIFEGFMIEIYFPGNNSLGMQIVYREDNFTDFKKYLSNTHTGYIDIGILYVCGSVCMCDSLSVLSINSRYE